jgi:hypothetical protein
MNEGFFEKYKKEIVITGAVVGGIALGMVLGRKLALAKYVGKSVISWRPNGKFINLEDAKALLDLNVMNNTQFAIVKDGAEISAVILNNSNVVAPAKAVVEAII